MRESDFYILKAASASKETGNVFPQIKSMTKDYNFTATNSIRRLKLKQFPDFTPNLDSFYLDPKAKQSNTLSNAVLNFGFVVDNQIYNIVSKFNLPDNRFFKASIFFKNEIKSNYFLFHYLCDLSENINYSQTEFFVWDSFEITDRFKVENRDQLSNKREQLPMLKSIRTHKYYFNPSFQIPYDIFHISFIDPRTYISHRLKTALEEAHITGIEIVPTDVI